MNNEPDRPASDTPAPCRECEETELHKLGCFFNRSLDDSKRTRVHDADRKPAPDTQADDHHQQCKGCGEMFETTNQRLTHWCKPATDTQDAPPERIYIPSDADFTGLDIPIEGMVEGADEISYTRSSTAEGLAEALRGVRRYEVAGLPCYCETRSRDRAANESDYYERKSDDEHEDECTAARAALARYEGKQPQ